MKIWKKKEYLLGAPRLLWDVMVRGRYEYTYDLMPMRSENMPVRKRLNLLAAGLNLLYRRTNPWSMPVNLQAEITTACNLRCPVCPTGKGLLTRPPMMMDLDLYQALLRETGDYLLGVFLWAWGEPLLHPRFPDFVRIAREHNVLPLLSTNGQNLDQDRVVEGLLQHPPEHLIVALDGISDETNTKYRVGARLEPALNGVRRLAGLRRERGLTRPRIHMRYIAMNHNAHELPFLEDFARRHHFDYLAIRGLSIIPDKDETAHARMIPEDGSMRAYAYRSGQRMKRNDYLCQHAFAFPTVLADGTVVVCDQDFNGSRAYGRFGGHASFRDIWFSDQAARVRRESRDRRDESPFCGMCPYADRPLNTCTVKLVPLGT